MALYSKYDRIIRKFVPSVAKFSYNPFFMKAGDAIAGVLALPFSELRDLPPNHLRIRIGAGNRIFNGHVNFIEVSSRCWKVQRRPSSTYSIQKNVIYIIPPSLKMR